MTIYDNWILHSHYVSSYFWSLFETFRIYISNKMNAYTLSHLDNDRDVSAYSGGRRWSSCAQLVCFLTRLKRNTGIDALRMHLVACIHERDK